MKSKMLKNKKGITLVSLVITIVIMLILAGVSISFVIGQNGLFKKSSASAETYKNASQNEIDKLNNAADEISNIDINNNEDEKIEKVYLYNHGDTCDSITGGWNIISNTGSIPGNITFNSDNITMTSSTSDFIITNNKINVSGFEKIHYEYDFVQGTGNDNSVGICTHDNNNFIYPRYKNNLNTTGTYTGDLDISGEVNPANVYISTNWNGKIVLKEVYIYKNQSNKVSDESKNDIQNLYNAGNQYNDITGGWKLIQNAGTTKGSISFNSDNITFISNTSDLLVTNNLIDVSKYKYIHFEYTFTKGTRTDSNGVGVLTYDGQYHYLKYNNQKIENGNYSFDLDLDGLTTPSNVYIGTNWGGTIVLKSVYMHN